MEQSYIGVPFAPCYSSQESRTDWAMRTGTMVRVPVWTVWNGREVSKGITLESSNTEKHTRRNQILSMLDRKRKGSCLNLD